MSTSPITPIKAASDSPFPQSTVVKNSQEISSVSWNVSNEQFHDLLHTMSFSYFKWDTYAAGDLRMVPEALLISRSDHQQIVEMTEQLSAVLGRYEEQVAQHPEFASQLAIPQILRELITYEQPSSMQLARYDFFKTPDGKWMLSEFNEDVPGGFNEIVAMNALYPQLGLPYELPCRFEEQLLSSIPEYGRVAMMYATGYSEDLQHMLLLKSILEQRGQEVILCAPTHLEYSLFAPRVFGAKIDSVIRFYPGEWFQYLPKHSHWKKSLPRLTMLSPLRRLYRQSKKLFAFWDSIPGISDSDRAFIKSVTPETKCFCRAEIPRLLAEQAQWVLKRAFGRMGDSVVMGNLVSSAEWKLAIDEANQQPDEFLLQHRFDVAPIPFSHGQQYPALGAFVLNGRFAGYYSRIHPIQFLTHEATYVPTLVEAI